MMPLPGDSDLLRQYATTRSESAFAEIVRRHVDLVYSAARRQVRDAHLAEDVTQAVFLILSQKATSLGPGVSLPGWLYNTTRFAANNARRAEMRRQQHEHKAGEDMPHSVTEAEPWNQIEPALDAAVAKLSSRDRNAVVLRFFKQMSLKEVGAAIGASEDAAKVRISRAIAKLRELLGVSAPATGLAVVLEANSSIAAPSGLVDSIVSAACRGAASTAAISISKGVIAMLIQAKIRIAAAIVLTVPATGAAVGFVVTQLAGPAGQVAVVKTAASLNPSAPVATADRSTPQIALKTLVLEMIDGTDHGQGWIAEDDVERSAGEAVSDMVFEANQLRIAAQKQFGKLINIPLVVDLPRPEQLDGDVRVAIYDDHAMVQATAGTLNVPLDRVNEQWRLSVRSLTIAAKFDSVDEMREECQRVFDGYKGLKDEVAAGQFESLKELEDAISALVGSKR